MIYKVGYIRDVLGNNYLGIKFTESQMSSWLKELYEIVYDNDQFETLISNQARRDRNEGSDYTHHVTIVSVMEFNKLLKIIGGELQEKIDTIQSLDLSDIEFKGIGKAEKNHNESYFVVISSPTLDEIRSSLGLDPKDFHITIGFDKKDVFGVRKNETIKKKLNSED